MLAAFIASLVVIAGLTSAVIYLAVKVSQAHKAETAASARQAQIQSALVDAHVRIALFEANAKDWKLANDKLTAEYDRLVAASASERNRAMRAERQRDDLLVALAAHKDPAALVVAINTELAALAGHGRMP